MVVMMFGSVLGAKETFSPHNLTLRALVKHL